MNELRDIATDVIGRMPPAPAKGSPLDRELSSLRRTEGGGGKQRAILLERFRTEMVIASGYLTLIVGGVADCLQVAAGRDNEVNGPALSFATRPVLELAGQIDWLLDDKIDAATRVRRYLVWRFADLRSRRLVAWNNSEAGEIEALATELETEEKTLMDEVALAGWTAEPTRPSNNGTMPAALLDDDGKREAMPRYGELVHRVAGSTSIYSVLSISAHVERYAMIATVKSDGPPLEDGLQQTLISGFGIDTNLAIALTTLAFDRSVRLLLGWNGASIGPFHERALRIMGRAGFDG